MSPTYCGVMPPDLDTLLQVMPFAAHLGVRLDEANADRAVATLVKLKQMGVSITIDDFGNLPAGIHTCSVAELEIRFGGGSEERQAEISELMHFIEAARTAGVRRLLVNGSFVTGKLAPNDPPPCW